MKSEFSSPAQKQESSPEGRLELKYNTHMINNQNLSRHSVLDTESKTPKLRFKEFSGEWEEKPIGTILTIGSGKDYKHLSEGDIPVFGTGGYMLSVNEYLYDGESVGIGRKGTIDNPMFLTGKFWTVDTLFYTHSFVNSLPRFIYPIFQKINWKLYNEASGVPSLSKSTIEKIQISVPSKQEQEKIASFLTSVDTKIEQLTQKQALLQQYKKGIMQQLFTQQLRFKAEDGSEFSEWEEKNGNLLFENISNKDHSSDLPILAITQEYGAIPRDMIDYQVSVTDKSIETYKVIEVGDFVISLRSFQGGIEYSNYKGICSPAYIILRKSIELNNQFYKHYFKTERYIKLMNKNIEGIRDGKMISYKQFSDIAIPFPSFDEQTKIANFLSSIDTKIEQVSTQLESTKSFKKALLQQMFV